MAGVPFEAVASVATTAASEAARDLLVREKQFAEARTEVERLLPKQRPAGSGIIRNWRKAIQTGQIPPGVDPQSRAFASCWEAASKLAGAEAMLTQVLHEQLPAARKALLLSARDYLPPYLVFLGSGLRERLLKQLSRIPEPLPPRRKDDRAHERHLLLYLQRICAKNDSLSEFGPEGWGTIAGDPCTLEIAPQPGIAQRETFLERWTAYGVAAALNADPRVRMELAPRLNPNGRIDGDQFIFVDTGEATEINSRQRELLLRCDGLTPAYLFGTDTASLERLASQRMIQWEVEVPALDPHALDVLLSDVVSWRDNSVKQYWLDLLQPIAELAHKFRQAQELTARAQIMDDARQRLERLGAIRETSHRFLYSASNPIGEECFRECNFSIGDKLINEVAIDAAPWINLWQDTYAFVASRVAAGLRALLEKAPLQNGSLPLPAFLRHCAMHKMPLTGPAMVGLAHLAFQEVKAAFRKRIEDRADAEELELSRDDCMVVRQTFNYEKFDEFTYPSADLQLEAQSVAGVNRGQYRWILAELHPPVALLHHGFYWSCPDKAALAKALTQTTKGFPSFHFGLFAADFTAATAVRMFDCLSAEASFVAPQRADPRWNVISPAEIEVYIDRKNNDVCLRTRGSGRYLGSFARAWVIPLGFHPFHFGRSPQMPRLRCGRVIVQRRSWTVTLEELGPGDYSGVSCELVIAVERLRAGKEWPRYVYIRPSEQALRRSGAEGRDKDTKPVFIDLESYPFLEILHRWLTKAGELEVTEMLPTPDNLLWQEIGDKKTRGRRSFELRTQILPDDELAAVKLPG